MITLRQERFILEYILSANATQSAIKAGYSDHTAKQQGSRLLSNVDIQNEIEKSRTTAQADHSFSKEKKLLMLENLITMAMLEVERGNISASNQVINAIKIHNSMLGHCVPKQINTNITPVKTFADMYA